jgi:hypothetical protein
MYTLFCKPNTIPMRTNRTRTFATHNKKCPLHPKRTIRQIKECWQVLDGYAQPAGGSLVDATRTYSEEDIEVMVTTLQCDDIDECDITKNLWRYDTDLQTFDINNIP